MKTSLQQLILVVVGTLIGVSAVPAQQVPQLMRAQLPGRQVKVSAICIGFGGDHDQKLKLALEHLHVAGKNGVDIACLPEEFSGTKAEPVPGPTTNAVAELAKQYHMYVICPIREQAGDKEYNTAVLLDRQGNVAGYYDTARNVTVIYANRETWVYRCKKAAGKGDAK